MVASPKKYFLPLFALLTLGAGCVFTPSSVAITNFNQCVQAGNAVMESYPRQCAAGGKTFVENIGNELEKTDLIRIDSPRPNEVIGSPVTITGEARGTWYFEASFPVEIVDANGGVIAQGIAMAQSDWMTEEFVPFSATLTFTADPDAYTTDATLILHKDNPSGLPEYDDALKVPVVLSL